MKAKQLKRLLKDYPNDQDVVFVDKKTAHRHLVTFAEMGELVDVPNAESRLDMFALVMTGVNLDA